MQVTTKAQEHVVGPIAGNYKGPARTHSRPYSIVQLGDIATHWVTIMLTTIGLLCLHMQSQPPSKRTLGLQ